MMNWSIWAGLIMGLGGSFHCLGMCGPLVLMMHGQPNQRNKLTLLLHHAGRTMAYLILACVFYFVGKTTHWMGWQNGVAILGGLVFLLGWIPYFQKKMIVLLDPLRKIASKHMPSGNNIKHFFLGLMNGWLPCGWSISAIGAALLIQDIPGSILFIILFGIGSSPALIGLVWSGERLQKKWPWIQHKWTRMAFAILGLLLILRGTNLGIPYISPQVKAEKMSCCER
jgi:sulfite exporter TauE/SafE